MYIVSVYYCLQGITFLKHIALCTNICYEQFLLTKYLCPTPLKKKSKTKVKIIKIPGEKIRQIVFTLSVTTAVTLCSAVLSIFVIVCLIPFYCSKTPILLV